MIRLQKSLKLPINEEFIDNKVYLFRGEPNNKYHLHR